LGVIFLERKRKQLSVTRQAVSNWETGKIHLTVHRLGHTARHTRLGIHHILFFYDFILNDFQKKVKTFIQNFRKKFCPSFPNFIAMTTKDNKNGKENSRGI